MVTIIPKDTPEKKVRLLINRREKLKKQPTVDTFFGKIPDLEDPLKTQKKIRRDWK